ncbi:aminotransferase class III-fold pyridoxal phosphate-dependent enzyme, partial [Escherichia coli]|nr:aminotransferase class III-fold pyridoxal phosphate-dependent enzyme [Escherichia coli]
NALYGVTTEDAMNSLDRLFKAAIDPKQVAAIVLEPVQGEGGFNVAPADFMQALRALCDQHGILLIVDEVQAGFARTGKFFAFEHAGIQPDIIVMSKAVGGGLPLAVLGIKKQFDAWEPGHHTGTFRGN